MFDFFNRRWRSTPSHRTREVPGDSEDQNLIRLLVVTQDDNFFLSVHEVATGCGWEARMVRTVERGLQIPDEFRASVAIYDWPATEDNWRLDVERLTARPDHPCVLLASPVDDEYLRAELVRHGGFALEVLEAVGHDFFLSVTWCFVGKMRVSGGESRFS